MDSEYLGLKDLNLNQYYLKVLALMLAKDVLPLHEIKYPNDPNARSLINSAQSLLYTTNDSNGYNCPLIIYPVNKSFAYNAAKFVYFACDCIYSGYGDPSEASILYAKKAMAEADRSADPEYRVHQKIITLLPSLLKYKIENKQAFGNPQKVFDYLNSDEERDLFLFNLDLL